MTERAAFFAQVDEILTILKAWPEDIASPPQKVTPSLAQEVEQLTAQAQIWEPLVHQLLPYSPAALRYVARQCRSRDGAVNRWVASALGPSRGNGLIGVLLSALASATVWGFLKSLAPTGETWPWLIVLGFTATMFYLIYFGSTIILQAHSSGRLLKMAEMLDAVVELQSSPDAPLQPVAAPIAEPVKVNV